MTAGHFFLDRCLHPRLREQAELRRSGLVVATAATFSFVFALAQLALSLAHGHFRQALPVAVFLLGPTACLALLRSRPTPRAAGHLLLAVCSTLVGIACAGEDGLEAGTLAWFGVICAAGVMSVGLRAGLTWLLADTVLVFVLMGLKAHGDITPWLHVSPVISVLRGVGLVASFVLLAILFDRTRREALAEAQQLAHTKSNLLANVSHELRTPMHGVLGLTDLLLESELSSAQREQLELLQRSGRSLVVLLNDLLDMSKVEAGKMGLDPIDFELRGLLEDLRAMHHPVAHAHGLTLTLEVDALPPAVRGDALRLRQVLNNLLNNAIKFTPRGSVTLTARGTPEGRFHFEVKDTGIGIAPDALPRLFSAFSQAEAGITRRYGGTGLGLALSGELVALMGGKIEVQSQLGHGTTMRFSISLAPSVAALVEAEPLPLGHAPKDSRPVLVVDDNPINLLVACSLVQKAGYRTVTATNGEEALAMVTSQPLAMVLMDCHMPVMDGYEATERIRTLDSDVALIPVIALTASALPEELERCRRAGMNDCLIKPVTLATLERTLRQVAALQALTG